MRHFFIPVFCCLFFLSTVRATEVPLLSNISARQNISLNGKWNYVIDPLETGYYDYRHEILTNGFFKNKKGKCNNNESPINNSVAIDSTSESSIHDNEIIEYNLDRSPIMDIPSDWNSKNSQLMFYEGTVWFKKDFIISKKTAIKYILYFGAVNYDSKIYVNGEKVGEHVGGFTPFNFDITDNLVDGNNFVVVKVDNKRQKDGVPTLNTDWWNYGGITREVFIAQVPTTYIEDYSIQLDKTEKDVIKGWIKLNSPVLGEKISIEIPELGVKKNFITDAYGKVQFEIKAKPDLWSPENPKLYKVIINKTNENIADKIGFRTIETKGKQVLLNGKPIFLRGISIHEEAPFRTGRAWSKEDAVTLLSWAKEMGCNYVRLAHYPHNETMVRTAEEMGLMVWSEIPVYWTISWENDETFQNAQRQLNDMIYRDKNRCGVIIWSIANETPHSEARDNFLMRLAKLARKIDDTRLISMAMEITVDKKTKTISVKDNLNSYVDVVSINEYMGWYWGNLNEWVNANWNIPYDKPVIISEVGGEALQGLHGPITERWTEEYQEQLFRCNLKMLEKIDGFAGLSPWILVDFRSPRRQLFGIQDYYNRKGLISNWGIKKKAFYVMQEYYKNRAQQYN